ncbi:hypothetical protein ACI8AG_06055 [Blastococcus sp. SYSU DS0552]
MYSSAVEAGPSRWGQVEGDFLAAMEAFDSAVVAGETTQGDRQNGKGDFFNDVLALLLENCSRLELDSRSGVPGLIFPTHNLDVTYPRSGLVEFLLEAKAVGTPKHPGSPRQPNALGRPGSADLPKRIKEAAFKTIDLKAAYGFQSPEATTPAGDGNLTTWLRTMRPASYLFVSARVLSDGDFNAVVNLGSAAAQVLDGVGLFCYEPIPESPMCYQVRNVPRMTGLQIDTVLYRACQDLRSAARHIERTARAGPVTPPTPAQLALEAIEAMPDPIDEADQDEFKA